MNSLVYHPITTWAHALRQRTVRSLGTARYSPALDCEGAAIDAAHGSFSKSGQQEECQRPERTHSRLTQK